MSPSIVNALKKQMADLVAQFPELEADETLRSDTFEGATDLNYIIGKLAVEAANASAEAAGCRDTKRSISERIGRHERRADKLREIIATLMSEAGLKTIKSPMATVSMRINDPKVIIDERELPEVFWKDKITRVPNREAVEIMLENGRGVPGAHYSNPEPSVTIRI